MPVHISSSATSVPNGTAPLDFCPPTLVSLRRRARADTRSHGHGCSTGGGEGGRETWPQMKRFRTKKMLKQKPAPTQPHRHTDTNTATHSHTSASVLALAERGAPAGGEERGEEGLTGEEDGGPHAVACTRARTSAVSLAVRRRPTRAGRQRREGGGEAGGQTETASPATPSHTRSDYNPPTQRQREGGAETGGKEAASRREEHGVGERRGGGGRKRTCMRAPRFAGERKPKQAKSIRNRMLLTHRHTDTHTDTHTVRHTTSRTACDFPHRRLHRCQHGRRRTAEDDEGVQACVRVVGHRERAPRQEAAQKEGEGEGEGGAGDLK
eukprot:2965839-Rhodomonas_salina.1